MPGLMATREKYGPDKPLSGARISGSLHMTVQTAVLIETLRALGADVRWASCNIFSTQDHAAAAIAAAGIPVFAWKGETLEEYWWCTRQALTWPDGNGPTLVVDDGGDATLLIHRGYQAENNPALLDALTDNKELRIVNDVLKQIRKAVPNFWHKVVADWRGVSEETTTGVHRLIPDGPERRAADAGDQCQRFGHQEQIRQYLRLPRITGRWHQAGHRCDDRWQDGCGLRVRRRGQRFGRSLAAHKAKVVVTEIDPICALQALMAGFDVMTLEQALAMGDIYVTTTGNRDVITADHMARMKDQAIVCNIGHFDNEIQVDALNDMKAVEKLTIKPQVDRYKFPDGHCIYMLAEGRLVNLGCATGHPSFVMSNSFTNQTLAQIDLWQNTRPVGVYRLSKELDEEVARLHLAKLGATLTRLTDEQAEYIGVTANGPFKSEHYRY